MRDLFPSAVSPANKTDETKVSLERKLATRTTCHGLRFIADSIDCTTKMVWTGVVVSAIACLMYGIGSLSHVYRKHPSYMSIHSRVRL